MPAPISAPTTAPSQLTASPTATLPTTSPVTPPITLISGLEGDLDANRADALQHDAAGAAYCTTDGADDHRLGDAVAPLFSVKEIVGDRLDRSRRRAKRRAEQDDADGAERAGACNSDRDHGDHDDDRDHPFEDLLPARLNLVGGFLRVFRNILVELRLGLFAPQAVEELLASALKSLLNFFTEQLE